jgi:hypothetical protein
MDFRNVLIEALKICGEHADDPFLLYCTLCDCARNDYTVSPQVEAFDRFNKTYRLVLEMRQNPDPRKILALLEKCKQQPDAPVKLCLNWIHTLFVFYYRTNYHK